MSCVPIILFGLMLADCQPVELPARRMSHVAHQRASNGDGQFMRASFYGGGPRRLEPNTHTANGERFNQWAMTAAHRTLPFGTRLRVCFRGCTIVRINDRGPAKWTGKSLDLSRGAAHRIGFPGTGAVRVSRLEG